MVGDHRQRAIAELASVLASEPSSPIIPIVDPDKADKSTIAGVSRFREAIGIETALSVLVGGSFFCKGEVGPTARALRGAVKGIRLWGITGGSGASATVTESLDMVLLSFVPGAITPAFFFEEHLKAVPLISRWDLPAGGLGYLHLDIYPGSCAAFFQQARLIPSRDPRLVATIAKTCETLGMIAVYLEAGSGSPIPMPQEIVAAVAEAVSIPILVGGGVRTVGQLEQILSAGAAAAVVGSLLEKTESKQWEALIEFVSHLSGLKGG